MEILKNILAQEDTVLFIGSGVSIWSGLPSWDKMISNLAYFLEKNGCCSKLVKSEAERGDLLQAASYGFDHLTKQQIGEFIRESCNYGIAQPSEIHEKIVTLGPTCFITTNYDNLIEEGIRKWLPDKFFRPPVTNRHLTETAEIVHTRSSNFVFKPHGDAADTESIILTREQYRTLLPGGERHAALETVKLLLASRPVVYIGFGLRDPDFMYLKDLLANTYKGGARDHYAIMADVDPEEARYWRNNYGIHLINYEINIDEQGNRNHNNLLKLLENLKINSVATFDGNNIHEKTSQEFLPQNILSLARHAGRLSVFSLANPELTIRAKLINAGNDGRLSRKIRYGYQQYSINDLLEKFNSSNIIITGLPGAGKSYSMKKSVAILAEKLNKTCLKEVFIPEDVLIPIYIDLKLYDGDIKELISKSLVSSLNFDDLSNRFKIIVFLDSFNELPSVFMENGTCERDLFLFFESVRNCRIIIGSRTNDGLNKLSFPIYCLEDIDFSYVKDKINNMRVSFDKRFESEIITLLQKPFLFNLFSNEKVSLPEKYNPIDLYNSYFDNIDRIFIEHYGVDFKLKSPLSKVAFEALNNGVEIQPLYTLVQFINVEINNKNITEFTGADVTNWLVSKGVLIPYLNGRFSFFHQSITEYLAATELANRYKNNNEILRSILVYSRWDQALFFTLPILSEDLSNKFLNEVIDIDIKLAIRASKYLESGRGTVVTKILEYIISERKKHGAEYDHMISFVLDDLIVEESHTDLLIEIINFKDSLGGNACIMLDSIKGREFKEYFLGFFITDKDDYNFLANGVSLVLEKYIDENDIDDIQKIIDEISKDNPDLRNDKLVGFSTGISNLLVNIDIDKVYKKLFTEKKDNLPRLNTIILSELLSKNRSSKSLKLASYLLKYEEKIATCIYFISFEEKDENIKLDWTVFCEEHIEQLLMYSCNQNGWAIDALGVICKNNSKLNLFLKEKSKKTPDLHGIVLRSLFSVNTNDTIIELRDFIELPPEAISKEPLELINHINIDWKGNESLLMDILKTDNINILKMVLNQVRMLDFGEVAIDDVHPWLDKVINYKLDENESWCAYLLSELFNDHLSTESIKLFIDEFNSPSSKYRDILSERILPRIDNLSTDDFSESAISYLLSKLNKENIRCFFDNDLLANTCTIKFVNEYLLPLLCLDNKPLVDNLRDVLISAGSRHGRRYISC